MTKIFNKIICKIRGHASLEKQMNPSCIVGYVCVRCKDEVYNKTIHQFDDWKYESEKFCNQEMTCKRCNEKMTRVEHDFSNWDGSCYQTRQCKRCEHTEDRKNHSWDETNWGARTDYGFKGGVNWEQDVTGGTRECRKCGAIETEEEIRGMKRDV